MTHQFNNGLWGEQKENTSSLHKHIPISELLRCKELTEILDQGNCDIHYIQNTQLNKERDQEKGNKKQKTGKDKN